ncbi:MAG: DUF3179 domain-containing protein [Xanthomonadales bacterium]|nr:DUF3179 domain-containing protein [Xanthomonadales bacterium]
MQIIPKFKKVAGNLWRIDVKTTPDLKIYLLSVLFLPALLAVQDVRAESSPILKLNAGLNDAWFSPETSGQGFFITVFPGLELSSLAWFTYDTELPPEDAQANLGSAGHRWITAVGPIAGNRAMLDITTTSGGVFDSATDIQRTAPDGTITLTFDSCASGTVDYDIPAIGRQGRVPIQRVATDNQALCEELVAASCKRVEPDPSHGPDNPPIVDGAIVPRDEILDGGPGPDGIPPLETPEFIQSPGANELDPAELVVGVKLGDDIRAYPHRILNWHEVVNEQFSLDGMPEEVTLSYCPLTGSAVLWKSFMELIDGTFGTSGLLYNSNLILYDRTNIGLWSQMLEQSIRGSFITRIPDRLQVVETTWETWRNMYPTTSLLSENTGFSRDYNKYPYGSYREDQRLIFPANNSDDDRLLRKERVLGINVGTDSRVYPVANFSGNVEVINDSVGDMQVVVAGSSGLNFGVVFNRELEDCTVLEFEAVQDKLPAVMRDNEGNEWDVFGNAVSGIRTGQQLEKTNSYVAYWFAWTAFFPGADIHQ